MSSNDELKFNEININKKIENKEYHIKDDVIFEFINKEMKTNKNQKYFAKIKKENEEYMGVLTEDFKKDLFGYSLFKEGDEYLGDIFDEKKHGFGLYNFKKENNIQDLYIGHFENNMINGEGVYINVLNKEKKYPNRKNSDFILIKYNCYIGEFEKGKFKKGKIYIFNQDFEKLTLQNEEEKDYNEISIEKHENMILVSKSTKKDGIISKGFIINIKNKDKIEMEFSFEAKNNSDYIYENLNDKLIEKELIEIYNKYELNFKNYNETIQKLFNNMLDKIDHFIRNVKYAKSIEIKKEYENFFSNKYRKILFN